MMIILKLKVLKMRIIIEFLKDVFKMCKEYEFCLCIFFICLKLLLGIIDEDIKIIIKCFNFGEIEYCGIMGCKCV